MKRKVAFLLLLMAVTGSAGGCWSRNELSDLAIILAAGADLAPNGGIQLSVQIARPVGFLVGTEGGTGGRQSTVWVLSAEGRTVGEAATYMAESIPRKMYWGHCMLLLIGEELARSGVTLVTDFFVRERQTQENMWIAVTEGQAKDVLESESVLAKASAQAAASLVESGDGVAVQVREFAQMLASKGIQPVATRLTAGQVGVAPGYGGTTGVTPRQVGVSGAGVFRGDRLIGWLDSREARGLLYLKGQIVRDLITVPGPGERDKEISLRVRRARTKTIPQYDGGRLRFLVQMKVDADIEEQQGLQNQVVSERFEALEEEAAEELARLCSGVLEKAQQEYCVDIFGFGDVFHRVYPREWARLKDRWDDEFARAGIDVQVDAHIWRAGLTTRRPAVPMD